MLVIRNLLCIAIVLFVTGCGRQVEGSVEYVDRGSVIKPENMEIQIVPFEDFTEFINSSANLEKINQEIASELRSIEFSEGAIEKNKKARLELAEAMAQASGVYFDVNTLGGQFMLNRTEQNLQRANEQLKSSADLEAELRSKISKHQSNIAYLKSGKNGALIFPSKPIANALVVKTDKQGRFSSALEEKVNYIVLAGRAGRYWFLPLNPKDKEIKLHDRNANGDRCEICAPNSKWPY